jgi:hypothetical protein
MSKPKARKRRQSPAPPVKRNRQRQRVIVVALILLLSLSGLILAQWRSLRTAFVSPAPVPQTSSPQLSKEYIYAGGKLIATEEPSNAGSAPTTPTGFTAHAASTNTTTAPVTLSWSSTTGATSYIIERSANYAEASNHGFSTLTTVDCTTSCSNPVTYTDNVTVSPNSATTYLYRVRAANGSQQSTPSTLDFITTQSFAETISNQAPNRTTIKATHFLELASAVNSVRAAAGLQNFTWSDLQGRVPASGAPILGSHLKDLRDGLNQAYSTLGLTPPTYTDQGQGTTQPPAHTAVQKVHIDELRQRTKGLGYWPNS